MEEIDDLFEDEDDMKKEYDFTDVLQGPVVCSICKKSKFITKKECKCKK